MRHDQPEPPLEPPLADDQRRASFPVREYLEMPKLRTPNRCPHCGEVDGHTIVCPNRKKA
jgi:hypothetical protein